jgi:RimJ/RimL family protein N-acetyltransferase
MTNRDDKAAQKILEKAGYRKEGKLRKSTFIRETRKTNSCTASSGMNGEVVPKNS